MKGQITSGCMPRAHAKLMMCGLAFGRMAMLYDQYSDESCKAAQRPAAHGLLEWTNPLKYNKGSMPCTCCSTT
jgi:hypothetical protein